MSSHKQPPQPESPSLDSDALMRQRQAKLQALAQAGLDPYANTWKPSHSAQAFAEDFANVTGEQKGSERVRLAGRIVAINRMGKAAFVRLVDGSSLAVAAAAHSPQESSAPPAGRLQLYVRKDALSEAGALVLANLDLGDIIGVAGVAMRTKTGELSLAADELVMLSKSLRPLPEKWHGLSDVEKCYRQRYLELIVNPKTRQTFARRAQIISFIRTYLADEGFMEVETPMMHPIPGGANAKPFITHHHALNRDLYLRIAPELYLKRLVVGGFDKVFEINRNFRNEGLSTVHNPEFTMLEFYEAHCHYRDLMDRAQALLSGVCKAVLGSTQVPYQGQVIDFTPPFRRLTMEEAVLTIGEVPAQALQDAAYASSLLAKEGVLLKDKEPGYILAALLEAFVESKLQAPTIIYDFPLEISPLARRKSDAPHLTERFELFVAGRELANAFSELNDPIDQRQRFAQQSARHAQGDSEAQHMDEDYLRALEHGLPPTGGFGLGTDRLAMLLTDNPAIRDVILFPQLRPLH